jgi:hypothetical protein
MPILTAMIESVETVPALDQLATRPTPAIPAAGSLRVGKVDGVGLALGAVLGTRLLVWAAAVATISIFGENTAARHVLDPLGVTPPMHSGLLNTLLAPGARWDSVWYVLIAGHGYFSPASSNFFPLYPLLVGLGARLFGNAILAGIAISIGSMIGALMLLYRLALLDVGRPAARLTVMLIAVFPASLFFSTVYPTSLFLLLTIAAIYAARSEQWALAGLCGGLAAATRSNGILLLVVLALIYLYGPRGRSPLQDRASAWWRPRFPIEREIAWLALVPAGLALYLGYLLAKHGAPLAPFRAATEDWGHSFGPPLASAIDALGRLPVDLQAMFHGTTTPIGLGDPFSWQSRNLIDVMFLAVAVAGVAIAWQRVPRVYAIYALVQLAQVTSFPTAKEPMIGLPRYMLAMFPLFLGAGAYLAERRSVARMMLAIFAALLVLFSGLWGYWALVP